MKFEELQVIWNTQDQQPLYAINEARVQAALWQQRQDSRRTWFRWNILPAYLAAGLWAAAIAANLLIFVFVSKSAILDGAAVGRFTWQAAALFAGAGAMLLYFVTLIVRDRQQEKRREDAFSGSLREELERGIAHLEYQIRAGGGMSACRKAIPLFVAAMLAMWAIVEVTGSSPWLLAVVGGVILTGFPAELWRHRRRVTRDLLPRRQTLESLRAKLANPPPEPQSGT